MALLWETALSGEVFGKEASSADPSSLVFVGKHLKERGEGALFWRKTLMSLAFNSVRRVILLIPEKALTIECFEASSLIQWERGYV